jgi:hypothetical protein
MLAMELNCNIEKRVDEAYLKGSIIKGHGVNF